MADELNTQEVIENVEQQPAEQIPAAEPQPDSEAPIENQPQSLEDAFNMFYQAKHEQSQNTVAQSGNAPANREQQQAPQSAAPVAPASPAGGQSYQTSGTVSSPEQRTDWAARAREFTVELNYQAQQDVKKAYEEKGIRDVYPEDLIMRNENGQVVYVNPDDSEETRKNPRYRGFTDAQGNPSLKAAEDWCQSRNAGVQRKMQADVKARARELATERQSEIEFIKFGPTYDKLTDQELDIMDELLAGKEQYNDRGEIIGYGNTDLNAVAKTAQSIAKRFAAQQPQQVPVQPAAPVRKPALDTRSSNSGGTNGAHREPKSIEDAFRFAYEDRKMNR